MFGLMWQEAMTSTSLGETLPGSSFPFFEAIKASRWKLASFVLASVSSEPAVFTLSRTPARRVLFAHFGAGFAP